MSRGLDCFHSNYVYRVLRPNEDPSSDLTCCAPRSVRTISQHVATGLKDPSRYISTTSSRDKALKWIETANKKSSWRYGNKRKIIVRIDVDYLKTNYPEIADSAFDLTNDLNRNTFLQTDKERKFSCAYNEVVFLDRIPSEAVSIEYIHGKGFVNNAGNLSQTRTTNPMKYNNLSASTPNSLNPSNSVSTEVTCFEKELGIDISDKINVAHSPISSKSDKEEIAVTPKAQLGTESTPEEYQLKNTMSEHTKYNSIHPPDNSRLYRPHSIDIKKSENIAVNPVDESLLKKPTIIRSMPINNSIKSPEKHVNYKYSISNTRADLLNEKNPLRRTLPNYPINLSPDNCTSSDNFDDDDDDDAKRTFIAEIMPPAARKYQLGSTKFNLNDSNDVKHTETRSNLPQGEIIKSENSPVKTPLYEPIQPLYPGSLYSDNKAENAKVPEVKRVDKPMPEMYSISRKMAETSKLKSIQHPAILPSYDYEQNISVSKAKIPAETNVYKSFEEKPKLGNITPNYSPSQYFQSRISSRADQSDPKSKIPVVPEVNTRDAKLDYDTHSFGERIVSTVPKSRVLTPTIIPSVYNRSSKVSEVTIMVEPGLKKYQLRSTIASKSECQTIQSSLYRPYSIAYPSYGFQKENNQ